MAGAGEPEVTLDGTIERVVFHAEDSSRTIARFVTPGHEHLTIIGDVVEPKEGMPLRLRGTWVVDKKYGKQFKVATYELRSPETLVGIEKFLGSGTIPGIGPELAGRMVKKFGMDTLDVIEKSPERLIEV
ncbi:MAG TPA: hypothetical protein VK427_12145, partial [Kofleriaceae bacterium]|nr:hypothetical protein [Kofleriaceae bacterium]